jgi:fructosamine-3-kinase
MWRVERRREARIQIDEAVNITVLSNGGTRQVPGRMTELSRRGMRIAVSEMLPADTPLKVDAGDRFYLGEVAFCRQCQDHWEVGIKVDQYLRHTPQLEMLRRSLAGLTTHGHTAKSLND